jgi:hypothetical protein
MRVKKPPRRKPPVAFLRAAVTRGSAIDGYQVEMTSSELR